VTPQESSPASWRPLLEGESRARALEAIEAIADHLVALTAESEEEFTPETLALQPGRSASLAGGLTGISLFFAYLDQARPGQGHDDTALTLLERAIDLTGDRLVLSGLYSGFSGVAWVMEHLEGRLYESPEGEDSGEEAAAALEEHLRRSPWEREYDLIGGLAGFGVYALERLPRPQGAECLRHTLARLAELRETQPEGDSWRTPQAMVALYAREDFPEGNFNLGVAHGVPGVLPILAGASAAGLAEARPLLDEAVRWTLAQKMPPGSDSLFPYSMAPGHVPGPSRLAWCYGDAGVAAALLASALAVGEPAWKREALEIGRFAARRPAGTAGIVDAGLCHGAAGVAHIFNRLYQASGDPVLRDAARAWFDWALDFRKPGEGVGGFLSWGPGGSTDEMGWRDDAGFLTGAAGVGLALLSAVAPIEPAWDRVMLISLPQAPLRARAARDS
jgi:lantibiotic modifying enzyme